MTTGDNRIILKRWLPTLRNAGEYKGDILVIDYGSIAHLSKQDSNRLKRIEELRAKGVIVYSAINIQSNVTFFVDRIRMYREYLIRDDNWKKYDVIMYVDGNDIIFYGPLQPLLDYAKETLCYVKEINTLKAWEDNIYNITKDKDNMLIRKHFSGIENNIIISGGMIVGPSKCIMDWFNWLMDMVKGGQYLPNVCDQQYLNVFLYFCKYQPSREVGYEWNYIHDWMKLGERIIERIPIFKNGNAYALEDGRRIIIEHRTGTGLGIFSKDNELLESDKDIMNSEYER